MPRKKIVPFETDCDKWWLKNNAEEKWSKSIIKHQLHKENNIHEADGAVCMFIIAGILMITIISLTLIYLFMVNL